MKFSVQRDLLFQALQKTQSVIEKRSTVQILSNILMVAKDSQLSLSATDLEVGVKITIPVDVQEEGKITLSAKHFLDIVKELPNRPLQIARRDNNWVEINCNKSRFLVVSLSAEEYPSLPAFEDKQYFEANVETLMQMIDRTSFAVSTDETRYHMNGVYFEHLGNNLMRMVACDGHRLSFMDNEVFLKMPEIKRGIIIPRKGLTEFRKLLDESHTTIELAFERGYLYAHAGQTYLSIRLIEAEFPDYRPVIPRNADQKIRLERDTLNSALKRVSLLAHEKSRGVKLQLQSGTLTLTSSNPDMGEAREELDVDYSGAPIEIGFNAKYLLDCLAVMKGQSVELNMKDRLSPALIQEDGQPNYTYVIMPMRI